jgi:MFS family permease
MTESSVSNAAAGAASGPDGGMFRSLRHRNARLFFVGLLVSTIGTWVQFTAMALLVYRISGRATDLGITVALQFLPMLIGGIWAGAFADRHDKRRLTLITQAAMAAQALTLGILDLAGLVTLPVLFVLSFTLGMISAIDNPARRGFVTELVEPAEITNAISLNTAVMTGSRVFGPAIAALAVGPLGTGWLFTINGLSFVAIIGALVAINVDGLYRVPLEPRGGTPVRDGLRFVRRSTVLFPAFVVYAVVSTFGFNHVVALPKIADEFWGGDQWFGWLLAATSIGSVLGSLLTARLAWVSTRWMVINGFVLGISGTALAWAPTAASAMVLAIPLGFGGAGFVTGMNALSQQECPPQMRGRVLALMAVAFLGSTPIGGPITGWVGDHIGARWSLGYGAVISLVAVAVLAVISGAGVGRWRREHHPRGTSGASQGSILAS